MHLRELGGVAGCVLSAVVALAGVPDDNGGQRIDLKTSQHVIKISPGPNECASTGSYSVHVYDNEGIDFETGLVRPRDGTVEKAWVMEGTPIRLWVWLVSGGSGALGHLELFELTGTRLKKVPIPVPNGALLTGYMGHDTFDVMNGKVYRSFPIYRENDPMVNPTGGKRCLVLDAKKLKCWEVKRDHK